jgi:hypothetical protein
MQAEVKQHQTSPGNNNYLLDLAIVGEDYYSIINLCHPAELTVSIFTM